MRKPPLARWVNALGRRLARARARTRRAFAKKSYTDRWHLKRVDECIDYLVTRTRYLTAVAGTASVVGVAANPLPSDPVVRTLRRLRIDVTLVSVDDLRGGSRFDSQPAAVVCLDLDSPGIKAAALACMHHPELAGVPFEYATATEPEYAPLRHHDDVHYDETYFHSPLLTDPLAPLSIYEESLIRFERKCDIRDFMDLFQMIRSISAQNIPGDLAEFGSLKGHSGYLMASVLRKLGSDKRVYLFDTFESFPLEEGGVDQFWSNTCQVDFSEVQSKFLGMDNVTLVKGEFTRTLPARTRTPLSLVHIDCDSYRGIRYVLEQVYPDVSPGGLLVFEDYGHPALLGARLAVDEFLAAHPDCFRFFSQFSGIYVARKPGR